MLADIRYAVRTLARAPGFTAVAVLTLALGMGANTAIFSLVYAVLLKPLPLHDPSRLVAISDTYLPEYPKLGVSPAEIDEWRRQTDLFDQTAWYRLVPKNLNLTFPGAEPLEVHATCASDNLFPMLGVEPALGRPFSPGEDPHSAILSGGLWRSRFNSDPSIVGKAIRLSDQQFTVIGVMPSRFQLPDWADLWLTQAEMGDEMTNPVRHAAALVARLGPGATLQQVIARSAVISRRLASEHPKTSRGWAMSVAGLQQELTGSVRPALLMLSGAVGMVLLIACANIANLLLSRSSGRAKEMAIRTALGAGSWRIVRQLLTESAMLALIGGATGLALAEWALKTFAPLPAPIEPVVLLFLVAVSLTTGMAFGMAPAVYALRTNPGSIIKSGSVAGGGSASLRSGLVIAEFAMAIMLMTGAGMLVKSFVRLMNVDPGFNPRGVLSLHMTVPPSRKPDLLFERIRERVRALPGVESIAVTNVLPLTATRAFSSRFNVPGSRIINPDALPAAQLRFVSPAYFDALRIPVRFGHGFTARDVNEPVVIVNETMARRFWPGRDPVGLKFVTGPWGPSPSWSTIVGVVGDVKQFGLDSEPTMDMYFPGYGGSYLVVRTAGDPVSLAPAVRREIHAVDGEVPISGVRTMNGILGESARTRRWTMELLSAFASLAFLLALIGIYGVIAWSVAQRTREIGIRMALGAKSGQVLGIVIGQAMKLAAIGLALGIAGAIALRHVLASLVFGVSTADPLIYSAAAFSMLAAALLACYVPARRASRVDPLTALRWE